MVAEGEVIADVFVEDGSKTRIRSTMDTDGKKNWKKFTLKKKKNHLTYHLQSKPKMILMMIWN